MNKKTVVWIGYIFFLWYVTLGVYLKLDWKVLFIPAAHLVLFMYLFYVEGGRRGN